MKWKNGNLLIFPQYFFYHKKIETNLKNLKVLELILLLKKLLASQNNNQSIFIFIRLNIVNMAFEDSEKYKNIKKEDFDDRIFIDEDDGEL